MVNCRNEGKWFGRRIEYCMHRIVVELFERQLVVAFCVVIIDVRAPVMHGKEVEQPHLAIALMVFLVVLHQNRHLQQLIVGDVIEK